MLQRIDYLLEKEVDFAIETTLSTRSYVQLIWRAKERGYTVNLFFVYLSSPEMAVSRVAKRVELGGHTIQEGVIRRRYARALTNFFTLYLPICDFFLFINNSRNGPVEIAKGSADIDVYDYELWKKLKED